VTFLPTRVADPQHEMNSGRILGIFNLPMPRAGHELDGDLLSYSRDMFQRLYVGVVWRTRFHQIFSAYFCGNLFEIPILLGKVI